MARLTGLARSTVSQRVDALIAHGFVDEDAEAGSTGGRPPRRLSLRTREHAVAGRRRPGRLALPGRAAGHRRHAPRGPRRRSTR
ncbi:helix-turn-helix domain-containing protein [Streptomyces sp. WAC 06738]|uniref:helix-turn-helix domain-containing protein n=1 Tax=Streptomyces sp. WAC 06738 TaxID=2203210 RepID=UPI001F0B9F88|nr:helix-turn-helix domain-containing protein [Streptomyces sp. WAC 06738]